MRSWVTLGEREIKTKTQDQRCDTKFQQIFKPPLWSCFNTPTYSNTQYCTQEHTNAEVLITQDLKLKLPFNQNPAFCL